MQIYHEGSPTYEFDEPKRWPMIGDVYEVVNPFFTLGKEHYVPGDRLTVTGKGDVSIHGYSTDYGVCDMLGKNGKVTQWSTIEMMIVEGWIKYSHDNPLMRL